MINLEFGFKNAFPHKRHLRSTHNKNINRLQIKPVKTRAAHAVMDYHKEFIHKNDYENILGNLNLEFGFKNMNTEQCTKTFQNTPNGPKTSQIIPKGTILYRNAP